MTEFLAAPRLAEQQGLAHGFFTRRGGVSEGVWESLNCGATSGDPLENVIENRARVAAALGVAPGQLLTCNQFHSPKVFTVTEPWPLEIRPMADAMVTKVPGLALGILTADCVPVLFFDPQARVIGGAHAGWRGARAGVLDQTVLAMEKIGARRERILAALGPCIWQNSYEVGADVVQAFTADDAAAKLFFKPSLNDDRMMFDLPGWVVTRLRALGLANVEPSPTDTYADPARFFSYRRSTHRGSGKTGSLVSCIALSSRS